MSAPVAFPPPVQFERRGCAGFATLDRPGALNALTLEVIRELTRQLALWATDPAIVVVVLQGAGERAFCAGGDIRSVCAARDRGDTAEWLEFFRREYQLIWKLSRFSKPLVALLDGVTMGGGLGLAWPATHRVLTERSRLAMPEAGIGLFPDVGSSHFLPRLPEPAGAYLALTGLSLDAADALTVELGGHFVTTSRLPALAETLATLPPGAEPFAATAAALVQHTSLPPAGSGWETASPGLRECFAQPSVEAVHAALAANPAAWARDAAAALGGHSPTSLRVIWRQLQRGRGQSLADALRDEFRLVQRMVRAPDFCEGVRATLVDRDHSPRWSPPTLAAVNDLAVARLHLPGADVVELNLPGPDAP